MGEGRRRIINRSMRQNDKPSVPDLQVRLSSIAWDNKGLNCEFNSSFLNIRTAMKIFCIDMMNLPIGQVRHGTNTEIGKIQKRHFLCSLSPSNRKNGIWSPEKEQDAKEDCHCLP